MEQGSSNDVIIGIDLGTTNSEVSVFKEGKVYVLKIEGSRILPSVVSIDPQGKVLIGQVAVNNELAAPSNTVRCVKRKMGTEELISIQDKLYTPAMISSFILQRLKIAAEEFLQHPVSKAVITVPAFFDEKQREATKVAAELAGLEAVRLLNEPTAAALAYSMKRPQNECCLVYDLGGGTFDVSIVLISEEIMEVKSSHGDTQLGGADFDLMIAEKVRADFLSKHQIDLLKDASSWVRIMRASEAAKIRLSNEAIVTIHEEFIAMQDKTSLHVNFSMTRTEFEAMIRPTLQRTLESIQQALEMAFLKITDIDRVVLVGGSTYIPLVSQMIQEELKIVPQAWVDPSLVVAMGAGVEAASLQGKSLAPLMIDITPHSLGTGCIGYDGYLFNCILIHRNTPLPCTASQVFYKAFDDQEIIEVTAYQGESTDIHRNQLLGKFKLEGLKNSPGRDIHIRFNLDRSGLLTVTATDISTGKQASETLKKVSGSAIKASNLADIKSVKLHTEPSIDDGEDDDFEEIEGLWSEVDDQTVSENEPQDVVETPEVFKKALISADSLLQAGRLDAADHEELSNELQRAKSGDENSYKRLSDLLYFLE